MENEYFSKEEIIGANDLICEDVPVPEWGGKKVRVKMLSALEKDVFENEQFSVRVVNGKTRVDMHFENKSARLAARCMIHPVTGERLFSDDEVLLLAKKSAVALQRVVKVAERLSGFSSKDVKDMADALKNAQSVSGDTD
jgi:hypothetical protein